MDEIRVLTVSNEDWNEKYRIPEYVSLSMLTDEVMKEESDYDAVFVSAAISVSTFYAAFLVSAAVVSAAVVSAAVVSAAVSSTAGFSARFAVAALSSLPSIAFTAF